MHLPDGLLAPAIWIPAAGISAVTVAFASRRAAREPNSANAAVSASLAAFVFVAQSLQFPIPGGASGHLLGGSLISILAGAPRAIIALSAVFTIQAFFFHDGGVTALGANILNGAIIPICVTAAISSFFQNSTLRARATAAGIASFAGILCGAAACAVEVGASGGAPFLTFFAALLGAHLWIATGEAIITSQLILLLYPKISEFIQNGPQAAAQSYSGAQPITKNRSAHVLWILILTITAVAIASEFIASRSPDGLETAARRVGLIPNDTIAETAPPSWAPVFLSLFGAGGAAAAVMFTISLARTRRRSL